MAENLFTDDRYGMALTRHAFKKDICFTYFVTKYNLYPLITNNYNPRLDPMRPVSKYNPY